MKEPKSKIFWSVNFKHEVCKVTRVSTDDYFKEIGVLPWKGAIIGKTHPSYKPYIWPFELVTKKQAEEMKICLDIMHE